MRCSKHCLETTQRRGADVSQTAIYVTCTELCHTVPPAASHSVCLCKWLHLASHYPSLSPASLFLSLSPLLLCVSVLWVDMNLALTAAGFPWHIVAVGVSLCAALVHLDRRSGLGDERLSERVWWGQETPSHSLLDCRHFSFS